MPEYAQKGPGGLDMRTVAEVNEEIRIAKCFLRIHAWAAAISMQTAKSCFHSGRAMNLADILDPKHVKLHAKDPKM